MEDHLKNQDRLDQEWEALAAYQADPCSTSVATDQSNARKNRYSDVLPCESRPLPSSVRCAVLCCAVLCVCVGVCACVRACVGGGGGGEICVSGWLDSGCTCMFAVSVFHCCNRYSSELVWEVAFCLSVFSVRNALFLPAVSFITN